MTNTKFRKRVLLSSIAMLLVALVALGSATFAWFVANPDVKASGVTATTKADSGIRIASDTDLYDTANSADYAVADQLAHYDEEANLYASDAVALLPASPLVSSLTTSMASPPANTVVFKTATAQTAALSARNTDIATGNASFFTKSGTGVVYYEDIWMYSDDASEVKAYSVRTNATTTGIGKGLKVALVAYDCSGDTPTTTLIGIWAADSEATSTYTTTGDVFTTSHDYIADTNTVKVGTGQSANAALGTTATAVVKGNDANTASRLRVYVYLDGEHSEVKSNNAINLTDLIQAGKSIQIKMSTKNDDISWTSF